MSSHAAAIQQQLSGLLMLVLDEADRLLDMGFKPDLDRIFSMLPRAEARQTQLFSATFPNDLVEMTSRALKRDHTVVNTIGDEADTTHKHVKQESIIIPLAQQYDALYEVRLKLASALNAAAADGFLISSILWTVFVR
jgi:ATP-dependent RNA helicase MSS116